MKTRPVSAVVVALCLAALSFTGCRTMEGIGEDVENAGEEISEEARDASR